MALQVVATPSTSGIYARPPKLNVYILDVSGSMGHCMEQLGIDTAERIRQLPLHDAVLVGLFSSPGWYRWLPGRVLTESQDYDHICRLVVEEMYARNTTCFSEILRDMPKAIAPFLAGFSVVTLTFMSDGCAVVPDLKKEESALAAAVTNLAPFITAGAVVAYGDYADRKTLGTIASTLGLELVTTDSLQVIGETFSKHAASTATARRTVDVPSTGKLTFAKDADGTITPLEAHHGAVTFPDTAAVYTITDNGDDAPWVATTPEDLIYSGALGYLRSGKRDAAVAMLAMLGDVAQVAMLTNALTNSEIAAAETAIQEAITDPAKRFTAGREPGCVPRDDAFDLIQLLTLLINDKESVFYPRDKAFRYKRIGRATKPVEGYPVFTAMDIGVPMGSLVGNATELNLSVFVSIPGSIMLPAVAPNGMGRPAGLPDVFPARIGRTYSLIANALPVVTQLPVKLSEPTFKVLCKEGVIRHRQKYAAERVEVLQLTRVPVCNKYRGRVATDWDALAGMAVDALRLGSILKVLKATRDERDPGRATQKPTEYTDEQYAFLLACGVRKDGSYSPPRTAEPTTDEMQVRVLEVKPAHSSEVSMKEFQAMIDGTKKWNYVGQCMSQGRAIIDTGLPTDAGAALLWLNALVDDYTAKKRAVDVSLNTRRFAIALTGSWTFPQETITVVAQGHPVDITFTTKTKKI